jgi:hypothetical protein
MALLAGSPANIFTLPDPQLISIGVVSESVWQGNQPLVEVL